MPFLKTTDIYEGVFVDGAISYQTSMVLQCQGYLIHVKYVTEITATHIITRFVRENALGRLI